jgi:hypothetical protein
VGKEGKDPDEELSDLIEKYPESMMAGEKDDGNKDEEALLGNEGPESGEEPSTFDPEYGEAHSEEQGKVKVAMVVMMEKTTKCSVSGWKM